MKILKGYVKNRRHPERCILESYIVEEDFEFCMEYLEDYEAIGTPSNRFLDSVDGLGNSDLEIVIVDLVELEQAHLYSLQNYAEVVPYVTQHLGYECQQG